MENLPSYINEHTSYGEVHNSFVESVYGLDIDGHVRFERFKPEHVSNEQWRELLGSDVDSSQHMPLTYGMSRAFLNYYRTHPYENTNGVEFSPEEEHILMLAAMTNNWGESRTGDVSYDQKTVDIEKEEKDAYRDILTELYSDSIDVKKRMLVERTIFENDTKLGRAFDAIQKAGYLRTGLQAFEASQDIEDEVLAEHLQWLCGNVLSNQIIVLIEYSKSYPPVRSFLENQRESISEAFEAITPETFSKHGQTESIRSELLWQNKLAWYEFNCYEAEDLKKEIINTALEGVTGERTEEEVTGELEQLLNTYSRVITAQNEERRESGEVSDKSMFGHASNFEQRYIEDQEELKKKIEALRELGLNITLTSGSFDLLHVGHAEYLEKAKKRGDVVIVGVDSDEKMRRKGPDRPVVPANERTRLLSHLRSVDLITLKQPSEEKWELIKLVQPDTLVTTQETYTEKEIAGLRQYCHRVVTLPPQASTSTSARIRRMQIGLSHKLQKRIKPAVDEVIQQNAGDSTEVLQSRVYATIEDVLQELTANE